MAALAVERKVVPMHIALTGATGFLGVRLVRELLARYERISVLAHAGSADPVERIARHFQRAGVPEVGLGHRLRVVGIELTAPNLGLPAARFRDLADELDLVVHCAGGIDLEGRLSALRAVNVGGTRHVLELATAGRRRPLLCHVSTAFVAGARRSGVVYEDELDGSWGFENPYEQSKYEAELLVRAWSARQRRAAVVLRPSILVDDRPPEPGLPAHPLQVVARVVAATVGGLPQARDGSRDALPGRGPLGGGSLGGGARGDGRGGDGVRGDGRGAGGPRGKRSDHRPRAGGARGDDPGGDGRSDRGPRGGSDRGARLDVVRGRGLPDHEPLRRAAPPVRVAGEPDAHLNLMPVDDAAELIVKLVEAPPSGLVDTYHVVHERDVAVTELRQAFERLFRIRSELVDRRAPAGAPVLPMAGFAPYLRHRRRYDDSRVRQVLGSRPAPRVVDADYLLAGLRAGAPAVGAAP